MTNRALVIAAVAGLTAVSAVSAPGAHAQTATTTPAQAHIDSARAAIARAITPRLDAPPPPAPPEAWLAYIGEYGPQRHSLTILEHNGILMALAGGTHLHPLRAIARDTFAFVADSQRLVFTRDPRRRVNGLTLDGAVLRRRALGPEDGATFKITPQKPATELLRDALAASPPVEQDDFLATDLVELRTLEPAIRYDIRYASTNNFMGEKFYTSSHAFMQRPAAEAVARAAKRLAPFGFGLIIHDAYRPWYVTKMFWDATPDALREFVADPANGSRHNRGAAVDLSLYDLRTGRVVETVSGYDEFSDRAFPDYAGGTSLQRWYRGALRAAMEAEGFTVYRAEWWHFDFGDWRRYRIGNQRFEDLR